MKPKGWSGGPTCCSSTCASRPRSRHPARCRARCAIPRGLVEFRADPASALHDAAFDRAKTVIAYCASGGRSALVGKTLKEMGYENVRNLGGFKGWLDAGGEVEKS